MSQLAEEFSPSNSDVIHNDGVDYVPAGVAADALGLTYNQAFNLYRYHGRLDAKKIGASLFITVESVNAEIARRRGEKN